MHLKLPSSQAIPSVPSPEGMKSRQAAPAPRCSGRCCCPSFPPAQTVLPHGGLSLLTSDTCQTALNAYVPPRASAHPFPKVLILQGPILSKDTSLSPSLKTFRQYHLGWCFWVRWLYLSPFTPSTDVPGCPEQAVIILSAFGHFKDAAWGLLAHSLASTLTS